MKVEMLREYRVGLQGKAGPEQKSGTTDQVAPVLYNPLMIRIKYLNFETIRIFLIFAVKIDCDENHNGRIGSSF